MGATDSVSKNGWRSVMWQHFNYVPRHGHLVVEALLEDIWPDEFRERVVPQARFRQFSSDPNWLHDLMEEMLPIQMAREEERRIGRQ